jgi:hypothetical protein
VFDVEGCHSKLSVTILLRKSTLSVNASSKYMELALEEADAGPCWFIVSLWEKYIRPKPVDAAEKRRSARRIV